VYTSIMGREVIPSQMLHWNLADEYAKRFHLPEQAGMEDSWQFRVRIARSLQEMREHLLSHEVLYNRRMSSDPFARGELSCGYDDAFIMQIAKQTETAFQYERQQVRQHRRQGLLTALRSLIKNLKHGIGWVSQ
jgi:hypothetical protein